ncbi:MAG: MBL fold metallo-hydrolase [Ginsengibacter sp.]
MSLFITSLASGSNGNCYYIANQNEAVLIDAGISCREIEKRMKRLKLDIHSVKAILISHEHSDHIRGVHVLAKKYQIPVYATEQTAHASNISSENNPVIYFDPAEKIVIGSLIITSFKKAHDACDPYSFVINHGNVHVGVFTDIGVPCANLINHFKICDAAFLEANYDDEMLDAGNYPYFLKQRIRGGNGHLSNKQALEVFKQNRPANMSHLFLAHLSKNNNCPKLVENLFKTDCNGIEIVVASRDMETPVYFIGAEDPQKVILARQMMVQQSLF